MQIWRVNVRSQEMIRSEAPSKWVQLGGRGLCAQVLLAEVPPACDPLGPHNRLVFAPGILAGFNISSFDRLSIGAKSPLTGGIKESNSGGTTALHLTRLGIQALIIEDLPAQPAWKVLHISSGGARLDDANDWAGKGIYETAQQLVNRYDRQAAISLIGPAGELGLLSAGISNLDKDGNPTRINARGGLGAVLGSKGIKAIVIDSSEGVSRPVHNPLAFQQARKRYTETLLAQPQTEVYRDFGTDGVARLASALHALPTRNFSTGNFEGLESIAAESLRENILARGGDPSHACMPGCVIRCSNSYPYPDGTPLVSPLEYETLGLMGANLGIADLDEIARLNRLANDLGVDSIEIGAALGVAAEAGLFSFGDARAALAFMEEIGQATPIGRLLGSGAATTARVLGVRRAPVVKGQAMSAYDPRSIKGTGVTYATSPQGADHTAGLTIRARVDHLNPAIQVEISRAAQYNIAGYDSLGACTFTGSAFTAAPECLPELLSTALGWDPPASVLADIGKETLRAELLFNQLAGFTTADDRLPEWMTREALPENDARFDVPDTELDRVFVDLKKT